MVVCEDDNGPLYQLCSIEMYIYDVVYVYSSPQKYGILGGFCIDVLCIMLVSV